MKFLQDAIKQIENAQLKNKIQTFVNDKARDQTQVSSLCWETLKGLKSQIINKNKIEDLPFCYMTMAKLFQATHSVPSFELSSAYKIHLTSSPEDSKNRLNAYLRERMNTFNLNSTQAQSQSKIYKWSLLYNAMLCMDHVKNNPELENNKNLVVAALKSLIKAKELNTTKSVHLLTAHLYLEHGHYLEFDSDLVNSLVAKELDDIEKTKDKEKDASDKKSSHSSPSFWDTVAKPPYYTDSLVKRDIDAMLGQIVQDRDIEMIEEPALHLIPMDSEQAELLPPRVTDARYLLNKKSRYMIQGKPFVNYDVSGKDFRCFFNSVGLDPTEEIRLLLENKEDLLIRAMVANEIVSAWKDYYELPQPVRQALNAQDLRERQARLDRLMESDHQVELRESIEQEQEAILREFRERASTVNVFENFVTHQIGTRVNDEINSPYPMMVMQQDVIGEELNHLPNLSAIDAIMHRNSIGLRIFRINGSTLKSIHSYIPQGATTISYIIYSKNNQHFTALVPQDDANPIIEIAEEAQDYTEIHNKIQAAYDEDAQQDHMSKCLKQLLKERFPKVKNPTTQSDDLVRLVLFLKAQGIKATDIVKKPLIPWGESRVGAVLNENGIYAKKGYDEQTTNAIFDAYLSTGYDLAAKRKNEVKPVVNAIAKHLKLDIPELHKYLLNQVAKDRSAKIPPSQEQRLKIVKLYKKGKTFVSIRKKMDVRYNYIFEVLYKDLPNDLKPKIIDSSQIIMKADSDKKRNKEIVNTFNNLKKKNKGKNPTASEVGRECGQSLKVTLKALKEAGLVKEVKKAKHVDSKILGQIKDYWNKKGWETAPDKVQHYEMTAKKFGITEIQVKDILKGRTFNDDQGTKRKRRTTPAEIKSAYEDLSPEQKQNPIPHLTALLPVTENSIKTALGMNENKDKQLNNKKPRLEKK